MAIQLDRLLNNSAARPFNSLTNLVDLASTAGGLYVVAPEDFNKEVYLFDTRGEEEATFESDITDNWVEDNKTMQDHIGLRPMVISLTGYVGELTNKLPQQLEDLEKEDINTKLSAISPFLPELTTQAQYIMNRTEEVYQIYEKANQTMPRLEKAMQGTRLPKEITNQQSVFNTFHQYWQERRLCTVYTPFGVFDSMAIQSLHARQEEETVYMSEFRVTFKQVRIAGNILTYNNPELAKKASQTLSKQVDKGIEQPKSTALELYQTGKKAVKNVGNKILTGK